ncbi:MAG: SMP-30/gluconolactonase/LRE family protein [Pseudomonadales bacterium]|nr:SMP-30/gluconolactonase/LRE family protein [Pseudomonadales bacterium]
MEKLATGYGLIEGPIWDAENGLIFSDVVFGGVYGLNAAGETRLIFPHRKGIGGISHHVAGGLVVSGRNIAYKAYAGGDTVILLDRDEAAGNVGYNDITTDAKGRIYAGSLGSSPVFDDGRKPQSGDLYLIDLEGTSRKVATDIRLTNGLGFSPDGKILYHSDSPRKVVNCYAVHEDGSLGKKEVFVEVKKGIPDGLVVSVDGKVWVALADGGQGVAVFNADSSDADFIEIPQAMCTSVCFGGADLQDLYIVTGSEGTGTEKGASIYRVKTTVSGLEVPAAKVQLQT